MERERKRLRLDQTDPSIPLDHGISPFLDASNDMIDKIFTTLSAHGQKEKMHMELVCRRFQSRIKERSSWQGENILELSQYEENIWINGKQFAFNKASLALAALLDRIQVEGFFLNDMPEIPLDVLLNLCYAITQHKNYINLKKIQLLSRTFDYSPFLTSLACCGLENVIYFESGETFFRLANYLPSSFYSILSQCRLLKEFSLKIDDISPFLALLLPALAHCHQIAVLDIASDRELSHENLIEFSQFCSATFPKLTTLYFHCEISNFEPIQFLTALGELLANLTVFGITLDPQIDSHRECLVTISNWFPKLKTLNMACIGAFPTETILEAIGNIFANYTGPQNEVYKFDLVVMAENCGDVLFQLAQKRWNENDELVKIVASNGTWVCIKNNVEIKLDLANFI